MAITVTTDTIVKIIVRSGTDSDRVNVILSQGELGYATNSKRLFIGDGLTAGGNAVGIRNFGIYTPSTYNNIQPPTAQTGDIIFDGTTLYGYTSATGWTAIGNNTLFDNSTIIPTSPGSGIYQVNVAMLSGGSTTSLGAVSIVSSNSANWNSAYGAVSLGSNSVLSNIGTNPAVGTSLSIGCGQFAGNSTGNLGAICINGVCGISTYAQDNVTYNVDGSSLMTYINNVSAATVAAQTDINDIGTVFYKDTSFVYSADTSVGTTGITNVWQNVFANQGCEFLRVAVTTGTRPRVVRVDGRLLCRQGGNATSNWARLGVFPTLNSSVQDQTTWRGLVGSFPLLLPPYGGYTPSTVPINVLDVASWEGHSSYSQITPVYLNGYYSIPANTTVIFGLQTFIFAGLDGTKAGQSWFELNGWQTGVSSDGQDGPRNLLGFTANTNSGGLPTTLPAYQGIYAWNQNPNTGYNGVPQYNGAPGSTVQYPQTNPGINSNSKKNPFGDMNTILYSNGTTYQDASWGVKNTSYIRAVFIG